MIKPFIKWAGGKYRLVPQLINLLPVQWHGQIPQNVRYIEPFLGSGAMLFGLKPFLASISDSNLELICTYNAVKNYPDELLTELQKHASHAPDKEYFYQVRAMDRDPQWRDNWWTYKNTIKHAARLIFLNKTCFNGLYRENKQGFCNSPFGLYEHGRIVQPELIKAAHSYLYVNGVQCAYCDYQEAMEQAHAYSFIFLDPPYDGMFNQYTAAKFTAEDQEALCRCVIDADKKGALFMLTNNDTPFIRKLYSQFRITEVTCNQSIASQAKARIPRHELVITNY